MHEAKSATADAMHLFERQNQRNLVHVFNAISARKVVQNFAKHVTVDLRHIPILTERLGAR
jgi:hypothetical protein